MAAAHVLPECEFGEHRWCKTGEVRTCYGDLVFPARHCACPCHTSEEKR